MKIKLSFIFILAFYCCCCLADDGGGRSLAFQNYYLEAVRQKEKGNYDAAYELFEHCLELDSTAAVVYYETGPFQSQLRQDSLAELSLKKAVSLNPSCTAYRERLAQYYMQMQETDKAAEEYEKILAENKTRSDILDILQPIYQQKEDLKKLLAILEQKEVVAPDAESLDMEVRLKIYLKKPDKEVKSTMLKLLQLAPDDVSARLWLLQKAFDDKDWKAASSLCQGGLEHSPEEPVFCYYLALLQIQDRNQDAALKTMQRGISLLKDTSDKLMAADMYAGAGDILHEKGEKEEAYDCYEKALECDSMNIGCLNNYAYFLSIEGGDLKKAEEMSRKTIEKEPDNATYLDTYAWILHEQGRDKEALPYMEKAMKKLKKGESKAEYRKHLEEIKKSGK